MCLHKGQHLVRFRIDWRMRLITWLTLKPMPKPPAVESWILTTPPLRRSWLEHRLSNRLEQRCWLKQINCHKRYSLCFSNKFIQQAKLIKGHSEKEWPFFLRATCETLLWRDRRIKPKIRRFFVATGNNLPLLTYYLKYANELEPMEDIVSSVTKIT